MQQFLEEGDGAPFHIEMHLVFADDGEAEAAVKSVRAGIETEDGAADGEAGPGGFFLEPLDQNGSYALALEAGVHRDVNQMQLIVAGRYPQAAHGLTVEKDNVVTGVWIHRRIGRHLRTKLHTHEAFPLRGSDRGESELRRTNRRVEVIQEDFVLWQRGANGESGHGSRGWGPVFHRVRAWKMHQLRDGKTPLNAMIQYMPR